LYFSQPLILFLLLSPYNVSSNEIQDVDSAYQQLVIGSQKYKQGSYVAAWDIFHKLAKTGNANAQFWVGYMYEQARAEGIERIQSNDLAKEWYTLSANNNFKEAKTRLANIEERERVKKKITELHNDDFARQYTKMATSIKSTSQRTINKTQARTVNKTQAMMNEKGETNRSACSLADSRWKQAIAKYDSLPSYKKTGAAQVVILGLAYDAEEKCKGLE